MVSTAPLQDLGVALLSLAEPAIHGKHYTTLDIFVHSMLLFAPYH